MAAVLVKNTTTMSCLWNKNKYNQQKSQKRYVFPLKKSHNVKKDSPQKISSLFTLESLTFEDKNRYATTHSVRTNQTNSLLNWFDAISVHMTWISSRPMSNLRCASALKLGGSGRLKQFLSTLILSRSGI